MKLRSKEFALFAVLLAAAAALSAAEPRTSLAFTVSMDDPASHVFRVVLEAAGFEGDVIDFKMPVWMPGYYGLQKYPENVSNFRAVDRAGNPLACEKSSPNAWRVKSANAASVVVSYDVKADVEFIVHSYLDDKRAYIAPVGVFMYVADRIDHPATVTVKPYKKWKDVATGLDPVPGKPNTFSAPDFDVLYDCPILVSNLAGVQFEVAGVPHSLVGWNLGEFDREALASDLKRMVEAAVSIVGEIPYTRYAFLVVGPGQGGIEHANSSAISFGGFPAGSPRATKSFLGFLAHEYFHLYNVKTIHPIELGPFDYDGPNRTRLLWFSEGFTSYYQNVILRRAGLTTADEFLAAAGSPIAGLENRPGRLVQTAAESSWESWDQGPFGGDPDLSISYYEKGAVIALLMDLEIRKATRGARSLDDVMRALYREFYREKKRGFTEAELKDVCERIAREPLDEIFEYANATKPLDYSRFLGAVGLEVEPPRKLDAPDMGATVRDRNGALIAAGMGRAIAAKKPGPGYRIKRIAHPSPEQLAILKGWLGE